MMLTTKGRYAVMAMVDLAAYGNGKVVTLQGIADRQHIAVSYLEQIFAKLRRMKLVTSVKGPGGGYVLAKPAEEITIADIVLAADESLSMVRCNHASDKGCMQDNSRCLTHALWDGLENAITTYLRSVSLADICNTTSSSRTLITTVAMTNTNRKDSKQDYYAE